MDKPPMLNLGSDQEANKIGYMLQWDRMKGPIFALVRAALPRVDYYAPRIARVITSRTAADGTTTLDVQPEDPAWPPMGGVPLFHGEPGVSVDLFTGTRVVVEFSEGDPARPLVRSWAGGEKVTRITFNASAVNVGGDGGEPATKGTSLLTWIVKTLATHTHPVSGSTAGPSLQLADPPDILADHAFVK